jgi:sulfide:quinone oxidoreductase
MRALLDDLETGRARRVAFVVPPGTTWSLPLYELAMLTAERTRRLGLEVELVVLTPEPSPAAVLGRDAGHAIGASLADRGIAVHHGVGVTRLEDGALLDVRGHVRARADRVVALPALAGPRTRGLPHDADGFLPIDEQGAVRGVPGVWAAGDATTAPYKQGGLAAQQADAAARAIARAAGAEVEVPRIPPKLLGHSAAGDGPTWFEAPATRLRPDDAGIVSDVPLWWPPEKVAMPYLGAYLVQEAAR